MKVFKKTLPIFMAAMMVFPTLCVHAAELDDTAGDATPTEETGDATPTDVVTPKARAGKSWNVGKNDPTEVVATYNDGELILTCEYTYDPASGAEELPNPGLMADATLSELTDYFDKNDISDVKVIVGSGVKTVGTNAFSGCSAISEVEITSGDFKEIKQGAFSNCVNLTKVRMTTGTEIGAQAFSGCSALTDLTISESVKTIGAAAFTGTGLTSVDIPSTVQSIGEEAFSNTAITSVKGGEGVKTVGTSAFSGAKSIDVDVAASDAIKNYDWYGAGYTDINAGGVKQVIVSFNTNGGDAIQSVVITQGEAYTAPKPVYSGMTFDGWYTDSALVNMFVDGTPINANTTLYAKWHGDSVTVTFDPNNGQTATTQKVPYGDKVSKPADPAPSGDKIFSGWFSDQACTTAFNFDTALTSDATIYAKWADATYYTVKFDTDGGSAVDSQSVKKDALVTRPADPTKTDYKFDGWYKESKFENKFDFDKDKITADTTIFAKFLSNKVTVKFDTRGGSSIASVVVDRGGKLTNPGNPTKDNSEFLGWYKDEGLTQEFIIDSETVSDNMTLYAKWNQTAFTVKWESNGGSAVEPTTANPNALIAKPTDPTKAGYYLVGWCKDSDLKNQWNFDSDKVTADITLYALWAVGDPATVDQGGTPGVNNTGAKIPQTGDTSNPLFHLFATLTGLGTAGSAGIACYTKRRKRLF